MIPVGQLLADITSGAAAILAYKLLERLWPNRDRR